MFIRFSVVLSTLFFLSSIQSVVPAQSINIGKSDSPLPYKMYNNSNDHFPPIFNQIGESCGSASGIGYVFNYEINAVRNTSPDDSGNSFPYSYTYNLLNDGKITNGTHTMFLDSWRIVRDNGIMNSTDFGAIESRATKWVSGYDNYYRGMHNRIAAIDSISFHDEGAFETMKQWLFDHGNGSDAGGIFTVMVSMLGAEVVPIEEGEHKEVALVHAFGGDPFGGKHDLTVVGYNDSIRYDFNYDGRITNDVDLNDDNKITTADYETGAFLVANSWGRTKWSDGFAFVPYRLFVTDSTSGGTLNNKAYFISVLKEYTPRRTFKVTMSHDSRKNVALSVGIAADSTSDEPEYIRKIEQFTNKGGALPMCGYNAENSIEVGLDVSDLLDSLGENRPAAYFLCFRMDDENGSCDGFSLFDYSETSSPAEYVCAKTPMDLPQGTTYLKIIAPKTGIASPDKKARYLSPVTFRYHDGALVIRPYTSSGTISVYCLNGTRIGTWYVQRNANAVSLPLSLKNGIYSICFTDSRNNSFIRTIPVLK